jgi:PAS domain-containing protein
MRRLLTSWKDVAAYIGKTTRTAQRWERELGLPIHRPLNKPAGVILADTDEIDAWISARKIRSSAGTVPVPLSKLRPVSFRSIQPIAPAYARVLESIARRDSCSESLELLVRAIEEDLECAFASILLLDGKRERLSHAAGQNVPRSFNQAVERIRIGPDQESSGTAAFKGEPVVVENVHTDKKWQNYREAARKLRFTACWSTPIFSSTGDVMGTFAIYYATPRSASPSEKSAMELASYLAGIILELNGAGVPDHKVSGNSAFFSLDSDWTVTAVNREATRFLGRSRDEVVGKNLWDLYPEYVGSVYHREYERAIREKVTVAFETFSQRFLSRVLVTAHPHKTGLAVFFRTLPH